MQIPAQVSVDKIMPTRKKYILEELPNSSVTEDMRKIRYILPNSTLNILTEIWRQRIDFTELYSKISRIR